MTVRVQMTIADPQGETHYEFRCTEAREDRRHEWSGPEELTFYFANVVWSPLNGTQAPQEARTATDSAPCLEPNLDHTRYCQMPAGHAGMHGF